jgi:HSP20 family protein
MPGTNLLRWDPFEDWFADPFRLMRKMIRSSASGAASFSEFSPNVEFIETKDGFHITADLPGVRRKDVEILVDGNVIAIRGKREQETREDDEDVHIHERSYGTFTRSFMLPESADTENISAGLSDGVLTVMVRKSEGKAARRIEIKGDHQQRRQIGTRGDQAAAKAEEATTSTTH